MSEELKPCPFCGSHATIRQNFHGFYVECDNIDCRAVGSWDLGASGAIEKWNTRPLEDALRARVAELEAELLAARKVVGWIPFDEQRPPEDETLYVACHIRNKAYWHPLSPMPTPPEEREEG